MSTDRFSDFMGPAYEPESEPAEMMSTLDYALILVGAITLTIAGYWLGRMK